MRKYSRNTEKNDLDSHLVLVKINAKDREHAKKLVGWAFDCMMSFEDKGIFQPMIVGEEQ